MCGNKMTIIIFEGIAFEYIYIYIYNGGAGGVMIIIIHNWLILEGTIWSCRSANTLVNGMNSIILPSVKVE